MTFYQTKIGDAKIVVYGVTGERREELPKDHFFKVETKGRRTTQAEFDQWKGRLDALADAVAKEKDEAISQGLHPLHDTAKLAQQVSDIAEQIVLRYHRGSFAQNFDAASSDERALLQASQMLVDAFDAISIFFNPASASFGQRRRTEPYRLLDKIRMILNARSANTQGPRIDFTGNSYKPFLLHDSFKLVPFALLENAQKYCQSGDVSVEFNDFAQGTRISVASIGPIILREEMSKIFERGFRGKYAKDFHHEGMGIGLYVAQQAARANGFDIQVSSNSLGYERDHIPQARNIFSFELRD